MNMEVKEERLDQFVDFFTKVADQADEYSGTCCCDNCPVTDCDDSDGITCAISVKMWLQDSPFRKVMK